MLLGEFVVQAKRRGVPVLTASTPDQHAAFSEIVAALEAANNDKKFGEKRELAIGRFDLATGVQGLPGAIADQNIVTLLSGFAPNLPKWSTLILFDGDRLSSDITVARCISNLRELFKADFRTLILMGPDFHQLDPVLRTDVLPFEQPYPSAGDLEVVVSSVLENNKVEIKNAELVRAAEVLAGLVPFQAEQAVAMSLRNNALDLALLWEQKKAFIKEVHGISIYDEKATYENVAGLKSVTSYVRALMKGKMRPSMVLHIDEFDKSASRNEDQSHEVSKDQHKMLLEWIDPDNGIIPMLLLGVPGSGKSWISKTTAPTFGIPGVKLDLGDTKGSGLVGQAEREIRQALRTARSMTTGNILVMATCNSINTMSDEMRSRFTKIFFFDYPTEEENRAVWSLYTKKYGCQEQKLPSSENWTPREIRACCMEAYRLGIPLEEAAKGIVPVSVSDSGVIQKLRLSADKRFLSASYPGVFEIKKASGRQVLSDTEAVERR